MSPRAHAMREVHRQAGYRGFLRSGSALPGSCLARNHARSTSVVAALHRSDLTGWTVGIAVSREQADASLRRSLFATAAGGLVFLLIALSLPVVLGRRIATPVAALSDAAQRLGGNRSLQATCGFIGRRFVRCQRIRQRLNFYSNFAADRSSLSSTSAASARKSLRTIDKSERAWLTFSQYRPEQKGRL